MNRFWPLALAWAFVGGLGSGPAPKSEPRAAATPAGLFDPSPRLAPSPEKGGLPLRWRINDIDRRFDLDPNLAERAIERACALWEGEVRRDLFDRDDGMGFPINFVFDHRQEHILASLASEKNLLQARQKIQSARQIHAASEREFLHAKSSFDARKADFEARLDAYNQRVALVNAQGGATESEASYLDEAKAALESDRGRLEDLRRQVLRLQDQTNIHSQNFNDLVRLSNGLVTEHNRRFGGVLQTIGECVRAGPEVRRINIYGYEDLDHLAIVLAHELGHALGLDHVEGAGAIMSEVEGGEKGSDSLKLTDRDRNELRRQLASRE